MTFSDGTTVIADAEHEWLTRDYRARLSERNAKKNGRNSRVVLQPKGNDQSWKRRYPAVRTTEEIAKTLYAGNDKRFNHAVAVCEPLVLPAAALPIPPYTLGVWLGDGYQASGAYSKPDYEITDYIREDGYTVTDRKDVEAHGVLGLIKQLRQEGLLNNKHIPQQYLRASAGQRMQLLQGLLDTDGHITPYGRVEFCACNKQLADSTFELIVSLGFRPVMLEDRARLNGKDYGPRYRITFTPDRPVFRLERKRKFCKANTEKSHYRQIVRVEEVPSVPVKCIQVDSPSHLYLATQACIPTHNSGFISAMAVNMAYQHGWGFTIFSPENAPMERYAAMLTALYIGKPFWGAARMTIEEMREGKEWLWQHVSFLMPEDESPTLDRLLALATIQVYREGIKGLVLDPWNEIDFSRPRGQTETEYVSASLGKLRRFALLHGVHVWLIAHPTKLQKAIKGKFEGQYAPPTPYDISGSSHFRNKADNCLSIWRDVDANDNRVTVYVQKVRFLSIASHAWRIKHGVQQAVPQTESCLGLRQDCPLAFAPGGGPRSWSGAAVAGV
jgi:hypothetical protein